MPTILTLITVFLADKEVQLNFSETIKRVIRCLQSRYQHFETDGSTHSLSNMLLAKYSGRLKQVVRSHFEVGFGKMKLENFFNRQHAPASRDLAATRSKFDCPPSRRGIFDRQFVRGHLLPFCLTDGAI